MSTGEKSHPESQESEGFVATISVKHDIVVQEVNENAENDHGVVIEQDDDMSPKTIHNVSNNDLSSTGSQSNEEKDSNEYVTSEKIQSSAKGSSDLIGDCSGQIRAIEIQRRSSETLNLEHENEIHDLDTEFSQNLHEKRVTDSKDVKGIQSLNYIVSVPEKKSDYGDDDDFHPIAFSGALTHSGLINQIPPSGNISHRSDSSISTRSFAFPNLASDWNASSNKISSPDAHIYRQRRRFWNSCFCCRCSVLFE